MLCLRLITRILLAVGCALVVNGAAVHSAEIHTIVEFRTDLGDFRVGLFDDDAPLTVANFLTGYVATSRYDNTIIHRFDTGLGVVQGGGFDATGTVMNVTGDPAIPLEYGVPNARGTIGMARQFSPTNSAKNQWFINTHDNSSLLGPSNGGGYAVFGIVLGDGMDVVDAIAAVPTFNFGGAFGQLPLEDYTIQDAINGVDRVPHFVVVESVRVVPEPNSAVIAGLALVAFGALAWRRKRC